MQCFTVNQLSISIAYKQGWVTYQATQTNCPKLIFGKLINCNLSDDVAFLVIHYLLLNSLFMFLMTVFPGNTKMDHCAKNSITLEDTHLI